MYTDISLGVWNGIFIENHTPIFSTHKLSGWQNVQKMLDILNLLDTDRKEWLNLLYALENKVT